MVSVEYGGVGLPLSCTWSDRVQSSFAALYSLTRFEEVNWSPIDIEGGQWTLGTN